MKTLSLLSLVFTLLAVGCGGSPGTLANPLESSASFVSEQDWLYVLDPQSGIYRMQLNGTQSELIVPSGYSIQTQRGDGQLFVLGDSNTNLFIFDRSSMDTPHRVTELDNRASAVALSPDGMRVAASRHADFDLPQSEWDSTEDDTLYIIDLTTLEVEVLPPTRGGWVLSMRWNDPDRILLLWRPPGAVSDEALELDLSTGARTPATWTWGPIGPTQASTECGGRKLIADDTGIASTNGSSTTQHITLEGRERGFHDYQESFSPVLFTPSCAYLIFGFQKNLYIHELATGKTAKLALGSSAWTLPND